MLSEVQVQTLEGTVTGQLDDGVALATTSITAIVDQLYDGQLNWEISDLPGINDIEQYRPLLPAIALSAAWLTAQEDPDQLMDGREATGNGMFQATIRIQYPQGQTLTLQSTSSGLSPEQPQRATFDIFISGSYPSQAEVLIGQTLSLPLQQTAVGVLSGQQNLQQGISVNLTITYQPLSLQAVPSTLLQLQLSPAEVDTTGLTPTIKFSAVAQLVLLQLPTVTVPTAAPTTPIIVPTLIPMPTPTPLAPVDRLRGNLDSLSVSASRDPTQDGKLDWSLKLPSGTETAQVIALLPGLTIPYAWIAAAEDPALLPDGLDLVGSTSFTGSVALNFTSGEAITIHHSSPGVSLSELSFSAERKGLVPEEIALNQLLPISLILEHTSDGRVQGVGFRDLVQISFTLNYLTNGVLFPALNFTLEVSDLDTIVDAMDGSLVLSFSTISLILEAKTQTLEGRIAGQLGTDLLLPVVHIAALVVGDNNVQLSWSISEIPDSSSVDLYQVLYPAVVLSTSWLHAHSRSGQLKNGQEVTGNGQFTAVLHVQFSSGQTLTINTTSHGFTIEEPKVSMLEVVISGSYPSDTDLSSMKYFSLLLEHAGNGLLSGQQLLSKGLQVDLTIAYVPLEPENIPRSIFSVWLSTAEVVAAGSTFSIRFGSRAVLSLYQQPTITIDLMPSTTVVFSSIFVSSSSALLLPTPTPPEQEVLLRGTVKGPSLPTVEIIANHDVQLSSMFEWIVKNFSAPEELELYRTLLPFIPLSATLLVGGEQFKIITDETKLNLTIIIELSPERILRIETSSSIHSRGQLFHQIEFSGSYPTISEVTPFYSTSMVMEQNEGGYIAGEQVLQGGRRVSIISNYLPSDFNPDARFLLTVMTHSPEALGLSFTMSSVSMFKTIMDVLSPSLSLVSPTSGATLSTGVVRVSSVTVVSSPKPPPPLPPICKFISSLVANYY